MIFIISKSKYFIDSLRHRVNALHKGEPTKVPIFLNPMSKSILQRINNMSNNKNCF